MNKVDMITGWVSSAALKSRMLEIFSSVAKSKATDEEKSEILRIVTQGLDLAEALDKEVKALQWHYQSSQEYHLSSN